MCLTSVKQCLFPTGRAAGDWRAGQLLIRVLGSCAPERRLGDVGWRDDDGGDILISLSSSAPFSQARNSPGSGLVQAGNLNGCHC